MCHRLPLLIAWLACLLSATLPARAEGDVWMGGADVKLATPSPGNAQAVGAIVEVTAPVGGDLSAGAPT